VSTGEQPVIETPAPAQTTPTQTTPQPTVDISNAKLMDLQQVGSEPRVSAVAANSYYAHNMGSYIKDENGDLYVFFPGSGQYYYPGSSPTAPDFSNDTKYTPDRILYIRSTDNGKTWSTPTTIIEGYRAPNGQQVVSESACTNGIVKYGDYYYLYFEAWIPETMLIGVFVARSKTIEGKYEIYTENGWQMTNDQNSTPFAWKPVITPQLMKTPEGLAYAKQHIKTASYHPEGIGNTFYGAGLPTARVENGNIVLTYLDTTRNGTDYDEKNDVEGPKYSSRVQVATTDPTVFTDGISYSGWEEGRWSEAQAVYFPEIKQYLLFERSLPEQGQTQETYKPKILMRVSSDGIHWSPQRVIADWPSSLKVQTNNLIGGGGIRVLTDNKGQGDLADLRLLFQGDFNFEGTGAYRDQIYEFKANLSFTSWDNTGDGAADAFDLTGDGKADAWSDRADGKANFWDLDYDGKIDAWTNRDDLKANMWDSKGEGKPDVFDTNGDGKPDWWSESPAPLSDARKAHLKELGILV